jgi:hypothetical protein
MEAEGPFRRDMGEITDLLEEKYGITQCA